MPSKVAHRLLNVNDTKARSIIINAVDDIVIRGNTKTPLISRDGTTIFAQSGIDSSKINGSGGGGGDIILKARNIKILEGGEIRTGISADLKNPATQIQGQAGDINIEASDLVLIEGQTPRPIDGINIYAPSEINSNISVGENGQGGKILIKTGKLQVKDGGQIDSQLLGQGQAGKIDIIARENVSVVGSQQGSLQISSSISSSVLIKAIGVGGEIKITAASLNLENGGRVDSSTVGVGNAGDINLNIAEDILIRGSAPTGNISGIYSNSGLVSASSLQRVREFFPQADLVELDPKVAISQAGNINITARSLKLDEKAVIDATSDQLGKAGDININLRDRLTANDGEIRTAAEKSAGGNIDLTAKVILLRNDSNIKTRVGSGTGAGGSITLTAPSGILLLEDSDLLAFSKDGIGGNITLRTPALLTRTYKPSPANVDLNTLDQNGFIDINATGAVSGIITLPTINPLQNNRPELPNTLVDPSNQLSRSCIARNPETGKFYITGAGGIPPQPGDPAISTYSTLPVQSSPQPIVEAEGVYTLANGKVIFGRACQ
jgi:large exoprotein involved in heme utilization and adhesion